MDKMIKKYCKENKIKFVRKTKNGFISEFKVPMRAGMEYNVGTGKFISIPIRTIGKKTVNYHHLWMGDCFVWDGEIKNIQAWK